MLDTSNLETIIFNFFSNGKDEEWKSKISKYISVSSLWDEILCKRDYIYLFAYKFGLNQDLGRMRNTYVNVCDIHGIRNYCLF